MKKKIFYLIFFVSVSLNISGCKNNKVEDSKQSISSISSTQIQGGSENNAEETIDYGNQSNWEFTSGKMQSPINIETSIVKQMSPDTGTITTNYGKDITKAENNGHSIQVTDGGKAIINGRNFTLSQFHFHAKSEHTIDGKHYPMEAHFVNTAQDGRIAVIGIFFKEGEENKGFQEVLDDVNNDETDPITDLDTMLPTNMSYFHYLGSLTTPPLNENVEWYVLKNPVEVSSEQIKEFNNLYSHNNREIQPLNDRIILEHIE